MYDVFVGSSLCLKVFSEFVTLFQYFFACGIWTICVSFHLHGL